MNVMFAMLRMSYVRWRRRKISKRARAQLDNAAFPCRDPDRLRHHILSGEWKNMLGEVSKVRSIFDNTPEQVRIALQQGTDPNELTTSAVHPLTVYCASLEAVQALLAAGADPNTRVPRPDLLKVPLTAFQMAVAQPDCSPAALKAMIDAGAVVRSDDLVWAKSKSVVDVLLDAGADLQAFMETDPRRYYRNDLFPMLDYLSERWKSVQEDAALEAATAQAIGPAGRQGRL